MAKDGYLGLKNKQKKCKGTGTAKGYGCGKTKWIAKYGLCNTCYNDWYFNSPQSQALRKSKAVSKKAKKKTTVFKHKTNTYAQLVHSARVPFQKLIRIRDMGKRCVSCNSYLGGISNYDAGHFISAESCSQLIFHPDNVHGQCRACNQVEYGNYDGYSHGIINRIGIDRTNKLFDIKDSFNLFKWDKSQLNKIRNYYQKMIRDIESGNATIDDVDFTYGIVDIK